MRKAVVSAVLSAVSCLLLIGCQGYREIDSEYLISAIGFEKESAGVRVYTEVLEVAAEKKDTKSRLFSDTGKTPYEAVENITRILPKKAVFDHCGTAIIDSNITAKTFKEIMKYLYDTKNLNLGICLYCTEDCEKVLSLKAQALSIGYDIMAIKNNIEKTSGIAFKNKYYEISGLEISKKGFSLPEISIKDNCPEISAQTVYIEFSPVFHLDKSEMMTFNLLRSGSSGGEISLSGKRFRYNRIRLEKTGEKGLAKIKIHCEYRSGKHRATRELKRSAARLLGKLEGNPAARLVLPDSADITKRAQVMVYDR